MLSGASTQTAINRYHFGVGTIGATSIPNLTIPSNACSAVFLGSGSATVAFIGPQHDPISA